MKFLGILLVLIYCKYADPYPNGAPVKHCGDMMPGHGYDPLDGPAPFEITYQPNNSTSGFLVTIDSPDHVKFKGFLIEARGKWDGNAIGTWQTRVPNTKTIDCFDLPSTAVTHNWHDDDLTKHHFESITFHWLPPVSRKLNRVKFIATIVQSYKKIYLNVSTEMMLKNYRRTNLF